MSVRFVAAVALTLAAFIAACGGGSAIPDDPRVLKIGSVAEEATYAYAADGPAGLYDFLSPDVRDRCSKDQFGQVLAGREAPTGFRGLKKVEFRGEEALVTVIFIVRDHDEDVEWVFAPGTEDNWYLSQVPGIEGCGR